MAQGHLARRPFSRAAALIAARCLSRLGQSEEADPLYQQAGPLDHDDQHIRALALVRANRREPAIQAYREILGCRPDDVLALRRLAAVLISQSRWAEALATAERLIGIPAGAVIGHTLAAVVHHDTANPDQSIVEFACVLKLDPNLKQMPLSPRSMFWSYYGLDLFATGRVDDAQRVLRRGLGEGDDAELADLLGRTYYHQGVLNEAESWWRHAVELAPHRADTWWRIGRLALQQARPDEAVEPLRRASELEPKAVGPVYGLSLAYRRLGRIEEAERLREQSERLRAMKTRPPSPAP
jgi:tetratricopeptide (TPR) repeat protein